MPFSKHIVIAAMAAVAALVGTTLVLRSIPASAQVWAPSNEPCVFVVQHGVDDFLARVNQRYGQGYRVQGFAPAPSMQAGNQLVALMCKP